MFSYRVVRSFYFAFAGIGYLFRTQRNARIHAAFGIAACLMAAWLRISALGWAIIVLSVAMVLIVEGLNTAVEAVVDLASPTYHALAKTAKDVSAAMVLLAAAASVIVGLLVLGPPLWHRFLVRSASDLSTFVDCSLEEQSLPYRPPCSGVWRSLP